MEHYEIEDLFFKRKRPKLKISLKVRGIPGKEIFDINVLNVGKIIAEKITIVLKVPPKLKIKCGSKWLRTTREDYLEEEYQFFENEVPFYPNLVASIGEIYHQEKKRIKKFKVLFLIVCNRMEVIKGEIEVNLENHNINYRELIYKNSSEEGIPFIEFW